MEHVPILAFVVITLLQLCRAQSSNSTPEWYAANDINDTNFSPKPITELFSTETSFSPEDPIIVLSPSSSLPSNRGIVSSPTPITVYSDSVDNQPPPNVIPLSSTEPPSPPQSSPSQATPDEIQPQRPSSTPPEAAIPETTPISRATQDSALNQAPVQAARDVVQRTPQIQPPLVPNRITPQQTQPRNVQFLLPTQSGNRIFQGQQLTSNGPSNIFLLYEQAPQNIRNLPPQLSRITPPQASVPIRNPQQQITTAPPNMVMRQRQQVPNQIFPQPNPNPPSNMIAPNIILFPQQNGLQQSGQIQPNQVSNNNQLNNPTTNQASVNQIPVIQQPINQMTPPQQVAEVLQRRPLRQRNRLNRARLNNRTQTSTLPCQRINNTATPAATAARTQNPVITIRLRPSTMPRNNLQISRNQNLNGSTTVRPRLNSQENNRNYERCLSSCRDRKDRICAGPRQDAQINPDTLKGFPSICHMACHNTFRANPIYERIANGRCGKLRTRIQTVDRSKIRRDELKKSEYTIISNIPGTVVEVAP